MFVFAMAAISRCAVLTLCPTDGEFERLKRCGKCKTNAAAD